MYSLIQKGGCFLSVDYNNAIKRKIPALVLNILRYIFFISFSFVLLYPFFYIISNSFKSFSDTYDPTVVWLPKTFSMENFNYAIKVFDFWRSLKNTFVYEILAALLQFCACAVAAYGLARFEFRGKKIFQAVMILSILVPNMMLITPSYVNFTHLDFLGIANFISEIIGKDIRPNIIGTVWAFYLPSVMCVGLKGGLFIYIFNQFFKNIPKELEEAAWIDGAGPWKTFLMIVAPSSGAAAITVMLFSIVWHWNDYYLAQMYNSNNPTLSVALNNFNTNSITSVLGIDTGNSIMMEVPIMLTGCLIFLVPMIVFYLVLQREFIASIANSGIVG